MRNSLWVTATLGIVVLTGAYWWYKSNPPKEAGIENFHHSIEILQRVDRKATMSDLDYDILKSWVESGDPTKQRNALGVLKMSKDPKAMDLGLQWAQRLITSPDEDVRHVALISLKVLGFPNWRATAEKMAREDPSLFVQDGAKWILKN